MPIPLLIAGGAAIFTGLIGVGAHSNAKDTNAEAETIINKARKKYDESVEEFESSKNECTSRLVDLGRTKKMVLDTSLNDFIDVYGIIKEVVVDNKADKNLNFSIADADVVHLNQISANFAENISSGVKGAAACAFISLAATGSLPLLASSVSLAGAVAAAGEIGVALELLGGTFLMGVSMTPFAAIAAPLVFFSGISASIKADENLEKAKKTKAEVDLAVEKMKISQDLCDAIGKKANMLNSLLNEINLIFKQEIDLLNDSINSLKSDGKEISISNLSEEDIEIIAVTRALAGAVKTIIDVPILTEEGALSDQPDNVYNDVSELYESLTGDELKIKENDKSNSRSMALIDGIPIKMVELIGGEEHTVTENEFDYVDIVKRVQNDYTGDEMYDISLYIKKEEGKIYYVVNGSDPGSISIPEK